MQVARTGLGYLYFRDRSKGNDATVYEHQLVAIAGGADPREVFSGGENHVHHGADERFCGGRGVEHPFATWRENLRLLPREDHAEHHLNGDPYAGYQVHEKIATDGGQVSDG